MFGMVRPCRRRTDPETYRAWMAHLCGLCLTLRDEHGQPFRVVTNYDGLLVSVLVEAQSPESSPHRRAGPCPLRGFARADVVASHAAGTRFAAAMSLLLATAKVRDHVADGDGRFRTGPVARVTSSVADQWDRAGGRAGDGLGFDVAVLRDAVESVAVRERTGSALLDVTEPTETAVAAVFAHTAVLAGRPGNAAALTEAGRLFGRLAHLLDAVEDRAEDGRTGAYNPLIATGTGTDQARSLCDDAVRGLRLALADVVFDDPRLVEALFLKEVRRAVGRTFRHHANGGVCGPGPTSVAGWQRVMQLAGPRTLTGGQTCEDPAMYCWCWCCCCCCCCCGGLDEC